MNYLIDKFHIKVIIIIIFNFIKFQLRTVFIILESLSKIIFPRPEKSLVKEVILVTGSGRGIGRELSIQLARCGAKIICWDINKYDNDSVVREIRAFNGKALSYEVDIGNAREVAEMAQRVRTQVGEVTMVINNAGVPGTIPFVETTIDEMYEMIEVNALGNFWVLKEILPWFVERGFGHVVAVSSGLAILPLRHHVVYGASKASIHGLMEGLRYELRERSPNIKFTTVYPFFVDTKMLDDLKVKIRFSSLFKILGPQETARIIVEGIRKDAEYIFTPKEFAIAVFLFRCLPNKAFHAISDFIGCSIEKKRN